MTYVQMYEKEDWPSTVPLMLPPIPFAEKSSTSAMIEHTPKKFEMFMPKEIELGYKQFDKNTLSKSFPENQKSSLQLDEILIGANKLLKLPENFDDEGSPSYSYQTLTNTADFLTKLWQVMLDNNLKEIPVPEVLPGPNGTIDILWETGKFDLLINISTGEVPDIDYYGRMGEYEIEGFNDSSVFEKIIDFLNKA